MQFPSFKHPVTGIAIPVGALKTAHSCGVGEFADLPALADLCAKAGIDLIQLLPVNDTGTESSPYSALSAFALHPIYIRLADLPEAADFHKEIKELKIRFEDLPRFPYREVRTAKMELLGKIFNARRDEISASAELQDWIAANSWIVEYAVFMNIKYRNFEASWKSWEKMKTPTHAEIKKQWNNPKYTQDHLFHAWIQMRLDTQFSAAVRYCAEKGIAVKGDIPIMMNEDSCDAWANPEFFRDDLRAGSPPDGENPSGQNWGFPIYNWENLANTGYSWWKNRLAHSARYYHAYRIDHILGFFRIWSIPYGESTGYLGWPNPHEPVTLQELASRGFSQDRLRWICEPHVETRLIEEVNNNDYLGSHGILGKLMNRIGTEELWLFKPEIAHESDIWKADIPLKAKEALVQKWQNRMLQITGRDEKGKPLYYPIWQFRSTTAWQSLSVDEKNTLEALFADKAAKNEALWRNQALVLLGTLTKGTDMLACAEDLGSIPQSVPEVLSALGIYGLKVVRWARDWGANGQPFYKLDEYPQQSVTTPSVHDSSTLRGWWEMEGGADQFLNVWKPEQAGFPEGTSAAFKKGYSPEAAAFAIRTLASSRSNLCVFQIQDLLALSGDFYGQSCDEERVNIPGSVSPFNWTYRLPQTIETIQKNTTLITAIQNSLKDRRSRGIDSFSGSKNTQGASK